MRRKPWEQKATQGPYSYPTPHPMTDPSHHLVHTLVVTLVHTCPHPGPHLSSLWSTAPTHPYLETCWHLHLTLPHAPQVAPCPVPAPTGPASNPIRHLVAGPRAVHDLCFFFLLQPVSDLQILPI